MPRTRILVADDHTVVAEGLRVLLEESFDLVGVVHDGRALLTAAAECNPDVVVTDISMPLLNGLDAVRQLKKAQPRTRVVILTMHRESELAVEAFRAGASAYMLKVSPVEELIRAIRDAAAGRVYVTTLLQRDALSLLMEAGAPPKDGTSRLTQRQREVLQLIAEGRTMKEVAALLDISSRTAESHKYDIMQVLGVQTTAELVQYAMRMRLIGE